MPSVASSGADSNGVRMVAISGGFDNGIVPVAVNPF